MIEELLESIRSLDFAFISVLQLKFPEWNPLILRIPNPRFRSNKYLATLLANVS